MRQIVCCARLHKWLLVRQRIVTLAESTQFLLHVQWDRAQRLNRVNTGWQASYLDGQSQRYMMSQNLAVILVVAGDRKFPIPNSPFLNTLDSVTSILHFVGSIVLWWSNYWSTTLLIFHQCLYVRSSHQNISCHVQLSRNGVYCSRTVPGRARQNREGQLIYPTVRSFPWTKRCY